MLCDDCLHADICENTTQGNCDWYLSEKELKEKWIPVSERLPDLWEVVLVTDECGKVYEYERRLLDEEGNVCEEWSFLGRKIIAWMPLPERYEPKEKENG